jgi:hypothetical protein
VIDRLVETVLGVLDRKSEWWCLQCNRPNPPRRELCGWCDRGFRPVDRLLDDD